MYVSMYYIKKHRSDVSAFRVYVMYVCMYECMYVKNQIAPPIQEALLRVLGGGYRQTYDRNIVTNSWKIYSQVTNKYTISNAAQDRAL
jgi:hypothetical protein